MRLKLFSFDTFCITQPRSCHSFPSRSFYSILNMREWFETKEDWMLFHVMLIPWKIPVSVLWGKHDNIIGDIRWQSPEEECLTRPPIKHITIRCKTAIKYASICVNEETNPPSWRGRRAGGPPEGMFSTPWSCYVRSGALWVDIGYISCATTSA